MPAGCILLLSYLKIVLGAPAYANVVVSFVKLTIKPAAMPVL